MASLQSTRLHKRTTHRGHADQEYRQALELAQPAGGAAGSRRIPGNDEEPARAPENQTRVFRVFLRVFWAGGGAHVNCGAVMSIFES